MHSDDKQHADAGHQGVILGDLHCHHHDGRCCHHHGVHHCPPQEAHNCSRLRLYVFMREENMDGYFGDEVRGMALGSKMNIVVVEDCTLALLLNANLEWDLKKERGVKFEEFILWEKKF
jgi:hypothetical protein